MRLRNLIRDEDPKYSVWIITERVNKEYWKFRSGETLFSLKKFLLPAPKACCICTLCPIN